MDYWKTNLLSIKKLPNLLPYLWNKEEILEEFGLEGDWEVAYETEEWKHVEEEKVSENEFFQSVAAAIEKQDPSVIVNKDCNTHWKNWVEFDYENLY